MQYFVSDSKFSYSRLDLFDQCAYRYKLKYIDEHHSDKSALALELGTLGHMGKEKWGQYLIDDEEPDFGYIQQIIENGLEIHKIEILNGVEVENELEDILGINDIKKKYFDSYSEICNKSGMTYDQKLSLYLEHLKTIPLEKGWSVLAVEKGFSFSYANKYTIRGFIDRIDINENGDLRVVDYKTSKAIYPDNKVVTPLQMFIYAMACEKLYDKLPIEFIYDFIFIGEKQKACTKGYYNRGIKKLDKLFAKLEECLVKDEYIPKPTPLCYWCDFSNNTPLADKNLKHLCPYYSLWTPNNKTFEVNKKYGEKIEVNTERVKKLFDF